MVKNPEFEKKVRRAPNGEFTDKPGAGSSGVNLDANDGPLDYMSAPMTEIAHDQIRLVLRRLPGRSFWGRDELCFLAESIYTEDRDEPANPYFDDPDQTRLFIDNHRQEYDDFLAFWDNPDEYGPDTYDTDDVVYPADLMIQSFTVDVLKNGEIFDDIHPIERDGEYYFDPREEEKVLSKVRTYTPSLANK